MQIQLAWNVNNNDKLCPGDVWIFEGNSLSDQCQGQNLGSLGNSAGGAPDNQTKETHAIPPFRMTNCTLMKSTLPVKMKVEVMMKNTLPQNSLGDSNYAP